MTKSQEKAEQKRANEFIDRAKSDYVCFDCGDKYRTKEAYDGTYTCHSGQCAICLETKSVSSSRKIFGHHKFV